jgi:hypothetical protein
VVNCRHALLSVKLRAGVVVPLLAPTPGVPGDMVCRRCGVVRMTLAERHAFRRELDSAWRGYVEDPKYGRPGPPMFVADLARLEGEES